MKDYTITLNMRAECDSDALELVDDYGLEDNCELISIKDEEGNKLDLNDLKELQDLAREKDFSEVLIEEKEKELKSAINKI